MKTNYVILKATRTMYSPDQCNVKSTMTIGQLKELLENQYDDELPIFFSNDNGYTYGIITEDSIEEVEADEDESEEE